MAAFISFCDFLDMPHFALCLSVMADHSWNVGDAGDSDEDDADADNADEDDDEEDDDARIRVRKETRVD